MLLSASNIIARLFSVVSGMLLARFRTLYEYGTYSQVAVIVSLASSVFLLGLPNSLNYFYPTAKTKQQKDEFLSLYYTVTTLLSLVLGVILVILIPVFTRYYKNDYLQSFAYLFMLMPWLNIMGGSRSNMLIAADKTNRLIAYNLIKSLCNLVVILAVQFTNGNFEQYLIISVAVDVVFVLIVYYEANRLSSSFRPTLNKKLLRTVLAFSIPIGLSSSMGTLTAELDKLMIGWFLDTESVAIYTYAGMELPLTIIASSFTAVLLPRITRKVKDGQVSDSLALWGHVVEFNYVIICFFVAACIAFAPHIITLLYSEKYLPGVRVFQIYSLIMLFRVTYFGLLLNARGKSRTILYCSCASLLINILLNYTFFYMFGFAGPALASLVSVVVVQLLQLFATAREYVVPFSKVFPWLRLLKITMLNLLIGIAMWAVLQAFQIGTQGRDLLIAILVGAGFLLVYALSMRKHMKHLWAKIGST